MPATADTPRIPAPQAVRALPWRGVMAAPLVAVVTVVAALLATGDAGVSFRDPDHVAAGYVAMVGGAVFVLVGVDIFLRAALAAGTHRPSKAALKRVREERWTRERGLAVGVTIVSFYVAYLAYRNLKAVVPLLRPGELFDHRLGHLDRTLLGGHDPAALLHSLLGTGEVPAQILSTCYVAFIVFLPLSLALSLVFARELPGSLFFATALSINWAIGALSYLVLPTLGPCYADPGLFAALPHTEATHLQSVLMQQRITFLQDPTTGTPQSIAAFASLHVSMSMTAVLAAHLLGAGRRLKTALWVWVAMTSLDTIYLGWHYVIDDLAGVGVAVGSLAVARALTGIDLSPLRAAVAR
jgi:ABC-type sugar transport system permease subunit